MYCKQVVKLSNEINIYDLRGGFRNEEVYMYNMWICL
jgi:hypothetical protein